MQIFQKLFEIHSQKKKKMKFIIIEERRFGVIEMKKS